MRRARTSVAMLFAASLLALATGCASTTTTFVKSETTLGRVVVYRNGVAYFERYAEVDGDELRLSVPADKVDDFLKSLTVTDAGTGEPAPIAYPTQAPGDTDGTVEMRIQLKGPKPHKLRLSYVTEAPSWKPSYRVTLGEGGKVKVQSWAIVDNTSGEDWQSVKLGVGASSALSFRFDLRSIRVVERETLRSDDLFAQAPPSGGATYGNQRVEVTKKVLAEFSDDSLRTAQADVGKKTDARDGKKPTEKESKPKFHATATTGHGAGAGVGSGKAGLASRAAPASPPMQAQANEIRNDAPIDRLAQSLQSNKNTIVVEGFADKEDGDKLAASLDRANRAREQLIRQGVPAERVVAVGKGEQQGKKAGVRVVEAPPPPREPKDEAGAAAGAQPTSSEPIGTSHFESGVPMSVSRGTSAMVSILDAQTEGEVVYLYDPESQRGNATFPFRSVRLKNPTDSALETGPVTVFGEGRFIGEGMSDPIPARSTAFVPFALDRQIVVEKKQDDRDAISRILTVQRGVFHTEVQHVRRTVLTLHNRLSDRAVVYVKHTVPHGFTLGKSPSTTERLGDAHLFRVEVAAGAKTEVTIEEATPVFKTTDIRSPAGMDMVRVYLSSAAVEGPLKKAVDELLRLHTELANLEQQIATMREQMAEYRTRMDELHAQIVTLRAVKTTGGNLLGHLEKKLQEVSEKLSKATVDLVTLQERQMVARVRFQDGVADLTLDKDKAAPAPPAPAGPAPANGKVL